MSAGSTCTRLLAGSGSRSTPDDVALEQTQISAGNSLMLRSDSPHMEQEPEGGSPAMRAPPIVIGLEDEQGEQRPVEIDETDEQLNSRSPEDMLEVEPVLKRRVSITDRVLRNKNCEMQMKEIEETANSRKNELAELLNEHAQIVRNVATMVKSSSERSLAEKENSMETRQEDSPGPRQMNGDE